MKRILALVIALACLTMLCLPVFAADDTVTVHARVPADWADPCCWAWKTPDNTNAFDAWPGQAMTKEGEWYTVEVPNWINAVIINGNGGSVQTADLTVNAGVDLWVDVLDASTAFVYDEEPDGSSTPVTPDAPSQSVDLMIAYVAGEAGLCGSEWQAGDAANAMSLVSDTVFEIMYKDVPAGTYQFKVTNGTWDQNWGGDGPDGNFVMTVASAGDVVIQFDTSTCTISVSGAGTAGGDTNANPPADQPSGSVELTDAYVAGQQALCGSDWNPSDPANLMTPISDTEFEIMYKDVAPGVYMFKVTNGTWDQNWGGDGPDGNYVITVETAGDVVIKFDTASASISVSGAAVPGGDPNANPPADQPTTLTEAYVAGVGALCGAEWDPAAAENKMTEVSTGVFEITYPNVAAGSYEFKITNGTWDQSWGGDGENGNYVLTVDAAGALTITFDSSTNTITTKMGEATEAPTDPTEAPTEGTEAPTEGTEAPTEGTEATTPTETTENAAQKAAVRTRTLLIIALIFIGIIGVATVISMIPNKNAG